MINYLISIILAIVTILYFMLEVSFKSFSKISLAGYLENVEGRKDLAFDYVKHYEEALYSLSGFTFLLQLCLFIYSFILLEKLVVNPVNRVLILIVFFLLFFNVFLYTLSFAKKEAILKRLIFLFPLARIVSYPFNKVFSIFIIKDPGERDNGTDDLSEKELEIFFEEGTREGVLEREDKEMIESVIEFGDTLVKEIMTPRVDMLYVSIDIGLDQLIEAINTHKKSRYPVISGRVDNIEGIILSKDVFNYWHENKDFKIHDILRAPFFIPETMRILELLKELQRKKQKFAIVVDEFGGISGLVTMEDIIEEIVGEIHDEYDEDIEQIIKEKDHFIVKGDTDISELNDTLGIKLEEDEDYQTVAGLISFRLGKIPQKSDEITIHNHRFQVIETEKNRIKKVKIYTLPEELILEEEKTE